MQLSELDWAYIEERAAHFTGRRWVFARLEQFLNGSPEVFLLLGEPGTGKTAVAAQLASAAAGRLDPAATVDGPHPAVSLDAAYFCRAGQVDLLDVAQRLSDQLAEAVPAFAQARQAALAREIQVGEVQTYTGDVAAGASVTGVRIDLSRLGAEAAFVRGVTVPLKRLREAGEMTRVVLLIDALDESLASKAAAALPQLLGDVEYAHLLVTSRPDRRAIDWLRDRAKRVDLLADAPPDSDDVLEYVGRRLTPVGAPGAMAVLARRIAERARGNFLYAFYVVESLRSAQVLAGLDDVTARAVLLPEGGLPGVYRDFLRRELWRDEDAWSERFGPVLAPLAVAQDDGLTTEQLRLVAGRLGGKPMTRTAVREVARTARQFLDGPAPDGPFRLYHQSFADFLVDPEQNPDFLIDAADTHEAIVTVYAASDPLSWDRYARRNLVIHASEISLLDSLLIDPRFLLAADPDRLLPALAAASQDDAVQAAQAYQNAVAQLRDRPLGEAAAYLQLHARQIGNIHLAEQLGKIQLGQPWRVRWARWQPILFRQAIGQQIGGFRAVAVGKLDGRPIVVSSSPQILWVWDLRSGQRIGEPLRIPIGEVNTVAVGKLNGRPIAVSGSAKMLWVWDLRTFQLVGDPLTGQSEVYAVAIGDLDSRPIAVSGGGDGTVQVWDLRYGQPIGEPFKGHVRMVDGQHVSAVAVGELDGHPIAISGGHDQTVRVWDLGSGQPLGEPLRGHSEGITAVAVGELDGRPIAASGSYDTTVRIWDLHHGQLISQFRQDQDRGTGNLSGIPGVQPWVNAVAFTEVDGRPVVVSAGNTRVRIWDPRNGQSVGEPMRPIGLIRAMAVGELDDRPVVVSASDVGVWVWDLGSYQPTGGFRYGQQDRILEPPARGTVAVGKLDSRSIAISTGGDKRLWLWDLRSGQLIGEPLTGHTSRVNAVAIGDLDGRPIAVSGGGDGTVQVWDLVAGKIGFKVELGSEIDAVSVAAAGAIVVATASGLLVLDLKPA
jgi:WD40 repeat protein